MKTIVLGAGLTGLSAAYHLGGAATVYEKEAVAGGQVLDLAIGGAGGTAPFTSTLPADIDGNRRPKNGAPAPILGSQGAPRRKPPLQLMSRQTMNRIVPSKMSSQRMTSGYETVALAAIVTSTWCQAPSFMTVLPWMLPAW